MRLARGFTLIELVAVLVVLAILAGVALPRYFNRGDQAKQAADEQVLAVINTALVQKYTANRMNSAPSNQWITQMSQVASVLQFDSLPSGTHLSGNDFVDQRGNRYVLTPETETSAARVAVAAADQQQQQNEGAGSVAMPMLAMCLLPWMARDRRDGPGR